MKLERDWSTHGENRNCEKCNSIFISCAPAIQLCKVCSERHWREFKKQIDKGASEYKLKRKEDDE
jgi:hypothetical protein